MDIRTSVAAQNYNALRPATEAVPGSGSGAKDLIADAAKSFAETLQQSETASKATMIDNADPQALVQALAQSELAVEAVVTVRNKVVEAYQEILRMPV